MRIPAYQSGGPPSIGYVTALAVTRWGAGMVNVARGARQSEVRAAQLAIHSGSCSVPSIGAIHFYPEHAIDQGAAVARAAITRRRNSWSREPEAPMFVFGF